jgi:hypothetical protein
MLAAALVDNNKASEAIFTSTLAGTLQQNINFTREHEWEADRIGTAMFIKRLIRLHIISNCFAIFCFNSVVFLIMQFGFNRPRHQKLFLPLPWQALYNKILTLPVSTNGRQIELVRRC